MAWKVMQMPTNIMKATFLASWKGEKEENKHEPYDPKYICCHACLREPVAFQKRSVIREQNNRWHNTNNTPSPDDKRSYR